MNKLIFVCFLCVIAFQSMGQSKYGFDTGIDTTAIKYSVRNKKTYEIRIDSVKIDTISLRIESYDTNGYIIKIEFEDWLNKRKNGQRWTNYFAEFKYNEQGYLVSESINWLWNGGNFGSDTIRIIKTEHWEYVNDSEILILTETINLYPNEPEWTEKCSYLYYEDGRKKQINCVSYKEGEDDYLRRTIYEYFENNLLKEIYLENDKLIFKRTCFEYEFYK